MTNMQCNFFFFISLFSILIKSMFQVNDNIIQKLYRNFSKIKNNYPQNCNLI